MLAPIPSSLSQKIFQLHRTSLSHSIMKQPGTLTDVPSVAQSAKLAPWFRRQVFRFMSVDFFTESGFGSGRTTSTLLGSRQPSATSLELTSCHTLHSSFFASYLFILQKTFEELLSCDIERTVEKKNEVCHAVRPLETTHEVLVDQAGDSNPQQAPLPVAEGRL